MKRTRRSKPSGNKELEIAFANFLKALGAPAWVREHHFIESRGRRGPRFDFAWPDLKLAVEIDGGVWTRGRHVRPTGFIKDCRKLNAAALLGWTVLRYTEVEVNDGTAAAEVTREAKSRLRHFHALFIWDSMTVVPQQPRVGRKVE